MRSVIRAMLAALFVGFAIGFAACADPESAAPPAASEQPQQRQPAAAQESEPSASSSAMEDAQTEDGPAQPAAAAQPDQPDQQDQPVGAAQEAQTPQPQQADAELEQPPPGTRVVSLFGDVTEILYALGVAEYLVGVDVSSVYPERAQELPNVGFAGALNAEGVLSLSPSVVIGGSIVLPGPPGVLEQLQQANVDVLVLPELVGLDAPGVKIRAIGQALGIPRRAEALAQRVEMEIEAARPVAEAGGGERLSVLFVYIRRGGIQLVSGAGREAETIITAAGGVDAGAAAGIEGWQPLSPEALLAINPDVYLVMELGYNAVGGLDGLLEIPGMGETTAGKHRRVIVMEDILLLGFGPRMADSIVQLRDYLAEVRAAAQASDEAGGESGR